MTARTLIYVACAMAAPGLTCQAREDEPADVAVYMIDSGQAPVAEQRAKYIAKWPIGNQHLAK